jgi:N-ethylmaleimide reductase
MYDCDPDKTFGYVADRLGVLKLAYLHVVETDQSGVSTGQVVNLRRLRDLVSGTYMANGDYTYDRATACLARGDADLIAFGRLFLANPDLPERFAKRAHLNVPRPETFYGGDEKGYTDHPRLES